MVSIHYLLTTELLQLRLMGKNQQPQVSEVDITVKFYESGVLNYDARVKDGSVHDYVDGLDYSINEI